MQILPKCYPNRVGFLAFVRRRARAAAASHETIVRLSAYSIYIITRVIFKAIAGITLVQFVECGYNFRAKDRRRRLHVVGAVRAARREAHHRRRRNRGGRRGCRCRNHRCRECATAGDPDGARGGWEGAAPGDWPARASLDLSPPDSSRNRHISTDLKCQWSS